MPIYQPYFIEGRTKENNIIVVCDHATNTVPDFVSGGSLGISADDMGRHIAYDVGGLGVSRQLASKLQATLIYSNFSRLVIDPNRGEDDPTMVMQLYDGSIIPANRNISAEAVQERKTKCYDAYHQALEDVISSRPEPIIISVHSFTKQLNGYPTRPWHIGILYSDDERLSAPLLDALKNQSDFCVGANQPYSGHLAGDTMERHAINKDRIHVLIEIRNDLIESEADQIAWADKLAPFITQAIANMNADGAKNG